MKLLGRELTFNNNEIWHKGNFDPASKVDKVEFDNLEIGGRNLLPNNDIVDGWSSNRFNEVSSYHYTTNVQSATGAFIYRRFDLDGNHIFQIQVKTNDENLLGKTIIWQSGGRNVSEKPITLSEDWQTLISVPIEGKNVAVGLRIVEGASGELLSRYLKLEKGNKATDWTPAPEDIQAEIDKKADKTELPTKLSQLTKDINFDERYYTETEVNTKLDGKVDNSRVLTDVPLNAKFTDTIYTHPSTHPASMITESTSRRFVSDTEKSTWNSNKITIGKTQPNSGWWFEEID